MVVGRDREGFGVNARGAVMGELAIGATPDAEGCARAVLARLFAGFGLPPGPHLDALLGGFVATAAPHTGTGPLDQLALEAAISELRSWFAAVLDRAEDADPLLVGRAAWCACGAAERWPDLLLARDLPQAFLDAIRAAIPPPVPPERSGVMLEQPFVAWTLRDLMPEPAWLRLLGRPPSAA